MAEKLHGDENMGSSRPYVSRADETLLKSHDTVACAYARAINKNSAEWNGKDLRGFIDFLWKTRAHRKHAKPQRWMNTCAVPDVATRKRKRPCKKKG